MKTSRKIQKVFLSQRPHPATFLASACNTKAILFQPEDSVEPSGEKVRLLSVDGGLLKSTRHFLKPVPDLKISNESERIGIPDKNLSWWLTYHDAKTWKNVRKRVITCIMFIPGKVGSSVRNEDADHTAPYWQPTTCMHCDDHHVLKVCPVDATFKRQDGAVLIDSDRCIGCRFCMATCPYSTRVFNWEEPLIPLKSLSRNITVKPVCRRKRNSW